MADCNICKIVEGEVESKKVYEDDSLLVILHPKPAAPGHLVLMPKEHLSIFENIPDGLVNHMFNVASKLSASIFASMGVQGTNIFMQNGVPAGQTVPHVMVHIIPRAENDGVGLVWEPKTLDEEEMSTVELKIKEETKGIMAQGGVEKAIAAPVAAKEKTQEQTSGKGDENYLLKQLERIP